MTIRIHRKNLFTSISNETINNPNLSWGAIGLLAFLQSKEEGTIVTREEILQACTNSAEEIDSFIFELESEGIL